MSFWLSAIPVQNCSLNLKIIDSQSARSQGFPTVQTNAGSYDTRTQRKLLRITVMDCEPGKGLFKENLTLITR
jgi:hypothetical protein